MPEGFDFDSALVIEKLIALANDMRAANVRAQLRVYVERITRRYGYPPGKQGKTTKTVLEQAQVPSEVWAVA